jgi:membrane associated rhomboid family serine protease
VKSKGLIGLYFVVGILGVVAGVANLLQKHYLFGAIYGLVGALWLLMATVKSRVAAPSASGPLDSAEPDGKPSQS